MKKIISYGLLLTTLGLINFSSHANTLLPSTQVQAQWVGSPAPDFKLQDQYQHWHHLQQYRGKWLVLYFYPKDGTPGCTEEARQFRDLYPAFQKANAAVLGVSLDDVNSHQHFSESLQLPFPILADSDHQLADKFGIVSNFGLFKIAKRETFLIDPKGIIVYHYVSVKAQTHGQQVLDDLLKLQSKENASH
jgi:peroxiredoxin Q/BCP